MEIIIVAIILIIGLMISGKRTTDKKRTHLVNVLKEMDESTVRSIGMRSLGINSSTSKKEIINLITKNWGVLKNKDRDQLTLEVMITEATLMGDEERARRLMNEKLRLKIIHSKSKTEKRNPDIYDVLDTFEKGLRVIALRTAKEHADNPMGSYLIIEAMSNFRKKFEHELMSRKRKLGFDEKKVQYIIEDIYTNVYEDIFEKQ